MHKLVQLSIDPPFDATVFEGVTVFIDHRSSEKESSIPADRARATFWRGISLTRQKHDSRPTVLNIELPLWLRQGVSLGMDEAMLII